MLYGQDYKFRIVSAPQGSPLPYASIFLKNSKTGTISNEDGYVVFNNVLFATDTVIISHIGYETRRIPLSMLTDTNDIKLESSPIALGEVVISPVSPKDIIRKAVKYMVVNYPNHETVPNFSVNHLIYTKDEIISKFQGMIFSQVPNYIIHSELNYRLVETFSFEDNRNKTDFIIPYYLDAYSNNLIEKLFIAELDFVKNTNKYNYSYIDNVDDNSYHISFYPTKKNRKHCFSGKIMINKSDMAFMAIKYKLASSNLVKERVLTIDKSKSSGVIHLDSIEVSINFQRTDGAYQISHLNNECWYQFSYAESEKTTNFTAINEIVNHVSIPLSTKNISDYESVSLYNLKNIKRETKQNNPYMIKYFSRKIEKKLEEFKDKYPEVEIEEFD